MDHPDNHLERAATITALSAQLDYLEGITPALENLTAADLTRLRELIDGAEVAVHLPTPAGQDARTIAAITHLRSELGTGPREELERILTAAGLLSTCADCSGLLYLDDTRCPTCGTDPDTTPAPAPVHKDQLSLPGTWPEPTPLIIPDHPPEDPADD